MAKLSSTSVYGNLYVDGEIVNNALDAELGQSIKSLSVNGKTITYTKNDGTTGTIETQDTNTTYGNATTSTSGLMSSADKTKLDGIAANANNYSHPTTSGNKHIPAGGSSGQILRWASDGTATWGNDNNTTYSTGTESTSGLTKLYTGTGTATDGTMTQAAINTALSGKANSSHGTHVPSTCNTITDWNSATTTGWYMANGATNAPTADAWYFGEVIAHNTNYVLQTVYQFTVSIDAKAIPKYIRAKKNGTWGSWTNVTVSKAVPSDAVFTDTWRGVQDNLTSTATDQSLSANQGKVLKGLIDEKAASNHTHSYLPLSGGTMTGAITSSKSTGTHLEGNRGTGAIINSTAAGSGYNILVKMNSSNGAWTMGSWNNTFNLFYTTNSIITEGNNTYTKRLTLLDENGNSSFPGTITGSLSGNASTATKLQTARSINGTSFDGSGNITTANWGTARNIQIGNSSKSVNGSSNMTWTLAEIGAAPDEHTHNYAATSHKHGLLHDNFGVTIENTTSDNGWSMINSSYNGFLLKSLRSSANAPAWLQGDYSAGIAFGGADTKGVMSVAYNHPSVRFAGGNGSKPVWYFTVNGSSGKTYNMDSLAANTANTLATPRTINGTNFDGSANITTANWGTARNIQIGNTSKSVNGSGNVSWSLSEIGAAASSHTHSNYASTSHTHSSLTGTVGSTTAPSTEAGVMRYDYNVSSANAGTLPNNNNANGILTLNTHSGNYYNQLGFSSNGNLYYRAFNGKALDTTTAWKQIAFTDSNITGNAATATKLQTVRTINGTNFDGTGSITTANWGTARNIQIGNTSKSVNGSANISWTLDEVGAASRSPFSNTYKQITVGGDANTYYPVLITMNRPGIGYPWYNISISRAYNATAPDTWHNATHRGGLTFQFRWSGDVGWGGNDHSLQVVEFNESYTTMVAGFTLSASGIIVWLRGGGALYQLNCEQGIGINATVTLGTYTSADDKTYPVRTNTSSVANEIHKLWVQRGGGVYDNNSRVYSANNKPTPADIGAAPSSHNHSNMLTFKSNHTSDWTSSSVMSGKTYMGGWHGELTSGTTGYISLGATGGNTLDLMIDGDIYVRENSKVYHSGNKPTPSEIGAAPALTLANGFYGMVTNDGNSANWIRTTQNGIIPYQSGGSSNLGTSSWPFNAVYATNFYGTLNGNATHWGGRQVWWGAAASRPGNGYIQFVW